MIYGLNLSPNDSHIESRDGPFYHPHQDLTQQPTKFKGSKGGANDTIKKLHEFARAGRALEAEQLLEHMKQMYCLRGRKDLKPDVRHFNSVINAWSKSHSLGKEERAEQILNWMCKNRRSQGWNRMNIKPTSITYNTVIKTWANSDHVDAGDRAMALLERMIERQQLGDENVAPDSHSYRSVIHAYSRNVQKGSAQKAEAVLEMMNQNEDLRYKPDAMLYHVVIHMYSHNREINAPQRAEALLNSMHEKYQNGDVSVKATTITFNVVLNTHAQSTPSSPKRAEEILQRMQNLYQNGNSDVQPDIISFNCVLNAHANSHVKGAAERAFTILNSIQDQYQKGIICAKPNTRSYNTCLKACCLCGNYDFSRSIENRTNIDIACCLLTQIHQHGRELRPDEWTYHWFFKSCQELCDDVGERELLLDWSFRLCCGNGMLTLRLFRDLSQVTDMRKLLGPNYVEKQPSQLVMSTLPKHWSCRSGKAGGL